MIDIVYEDDYLIVVNKPVGLSSQKEDKESLVTELEILKNQSIYPVHRLDKMVSGLIIYARDSKTAGKLSKVINNGFFEKEYLAVVENPFEEEKGDLTDLLYYDRKKNKSYVVDRERNGVKEARLNYQVLEQQDNKALIRVNLLTGRTHQIRVQFANQGHPLCGDGKYGSKDNHCTVALHSYQMTFKHPITNRLMNFHSYPEMKYPWNLFEKLKDK